MAEQEKNTFIETEHEMLRFWEENDCSSDHVWSVIESLCAEDPRIVGLSLSRNFGQQSARMAALPYVDGDYVVFMDDDGQHKAADALRMLDKLREGYDIVYAYFRKKRNARLYKRRRAVVFERVKNQNRHNN